MSGIFDRKKEIEQSRNDWRKAAFIQLFLILVLIVCLVWRQFDYPVMVMDYDGLSGAGAAGKIKASDPRESAVFMQDLAELDLSMLTSWTPNNISVRYQRFKNRLSSRLYAGMVIKMGEEERDYGARGFSQDFRVEGTQVVGNKVRVRGVLTRWAGSQEVYKGSSTYEMTYKLRRKGWPEIDSIRLNPTESLVPTPADAAAATTGKK